MEPKCLDFLFFKVDLTPKLVFKDFELVYLRSFEMDWEQNYRESSFMLGG